MSYAILDGKALSRKIRDSIRQEVAELVSRYGKRPGLAVVLVGEDPASEIYVSRKAAACEETGIASQVYRCPASMTQEELIALIHKLNDDSAVHGILVQSPLPRHIDEGEATDAIDPRKDVDGFHPINVGRLVTGRDVVHKPCTPSGVMALLNEYDVELNGRKALVIGRSNIVGKPMACMLLNANSTVTIAHSRTRDLAAECRQADIIVAAVGKAGLVTADMVKDGAVVIDVGMNRLPGKLVGDVEFDQVAPKTSAITPVPGGVGPMTIAMLLTNTVNGFKEYFI